MSSLSRRKKMKSGHRTPPAGGLVVVDGGECVEPWARRVAVPGLGTRALHFGLDHHVFPRIEFRRRLAVFTDEHAPVVAFEVVDFLRLCVPDTRGHQSVLRLREENETRLFGHFAKCLVCRFPTVEKSRNVSAVLVQPPLRREVRVAPQRLFCAIDLRQYRQFKVRVWDKVALRVAALKTFYQIVVDPQSNERLFCE